MEHTRLPSSLLAGKCDPLAPSPRPQAHVPFYPLFYSRYFKIQSSVNLMSLVRICVRIGCWASAVIPFRPVFAERSIGIDVSKLPISAIDRFPDADLAPHRHLPFGDILLSEGIIRSNIEPKIVMERTREYFNPFAFRKEFRNTFRNDAWVATLPMALDESLFAEVRRKYETMIK